MSQDRRDGNQMRELDQHPDHDRCLADPQLGQGDGGHRQHQRCIPGRRRHGQQHAIGSTDPGPPSGELADQEGDRKEDDHRQKSVSEQDGLIDDH
jgi:hypothetical protein